MKNIPNCKEYINSLIENISFLNDVVKSQTYKDLEDLYTIIGNKLARDKAEQLASINCILYLLDRKLHVEIIGMYASYCNHNWTYNHSSVKDYFANGFDCYSSIRTLEETKSKLIAEIKSIL